MAIMLSKQYLTATISLSLAFALLVAVSVSPRGMSMVGVQFDADVIVRTSQAAEELLFRTVELNVSLFVLRIILV